MKFIINEHISTETSTGAFRELDKLYMTLPKDIDLSFASDEYVSLLRNKLKLIRETAAACIAIKKAI